MKASKLKGISYKAEVKVCEKFPASLGFWEVAIYQYDVLWVEGTSNILFIGALNIALISVINFWWHDLCMLI